MRSEFISLFAELNAQELENLSRETREKVATKAQVKNAKPVFTSANFWNIQNMRRVRTSRRYF